MQSEARVQLSKLGTFFEISETVFIHQQVRIQICYYKQDLIICCPCTSLPASLDIQKLDLTSNSISLGVSLLVPAGRMYSGLASLNTTNVNISFPTAVPSSSVPSSLVTSVI